MKQYTQPEVEAIARRLGKAVKGGEVLELVGDVGAGKTTFTKAFALGLGIETTIQSPTFTISNTYQARGNLELRHYDFYRLHDAGVMRDELAEALENPTVVTAIEWSEIVQSVLPEDRLTITFSPVEDDARSLVFSAGGPSSKKLLEAIQ